MTRNLEKVSVLLTNYNKGDYLDSIKITICELLSKGAEIVIVDDGSTDGSYEILKDLYLGLPSVHLVTQLNSGSAVSRNNATGLATRKYTFFLDFDDRLNVNVLENAVEKLENSKSELGMLNYEILPDIGVMRMPLNLESPTNVNLGDHRDQIFSSMGYWRYIYLTEAIFKNNLKFTPTFDEVGTQFILDDLYWLLHLSSMNLQVLIFPDTDIVYQYHLGNQNKEGSKRFRNQVKVISNASLIFLDYIDTCKHNHNMDWLISNLIRITNEHLKFMYIHQLIFVLPDYVNFRKRIKKYGVVKMNSNVVSDLGKIFAQTTKNFIRALPLISGGIAVLRKSGSK